jgi:hypothetical protein
MLDADRIAAKRRRSTSTDRWLGDQTDVQHRHSDIAVIFVNVVVKRVPVLSVIP